MGAIGPIDSSVCCREIITVVEQQQVMFASQAMEVDDMVARSLFVWCRMCKPDNVENGVRMAGPEQVVSFVDLRK